MYRVIFFHGQSKLTFIFVDIRGGKFQKKKNREFFSKTYRSLIRSHRGNFFPKKKKRTCTIIRETRVPPQAGPRDFRRRIIYLRTKNWPTFFEEKWAWCLIRLIGSSDNNLLTLAKITCGKARNLGSQAGSDRQMAAIASKAPFRDSDFLASCAHTLALYSGMSSEHGK